MLHGLTMLPSDLILRNDQLNAVRVVRVRDWMLQETDGSHDLSLFNNAFLLLIAQEIARISNDHVRFDGIFTTLDALKLSLGFVDDLVDRLV